MSTSISKQKDLRDPGENRFSRTKSNDLFQSLRLFFSDIKVAHSIFALPFVASAVILSQPENLSLSSSTAIILCMIFARSYAMGLNRYFDREIDLRNPRTRMRMIPSGLLLPAHGLFWSCFMGLSFIFSSFYLNKMAGFCSFGVLVILGCYPFMKRITWMTHWYLGLCLGLAPIAAAVALSSLNQGIIFLGVGVTLWTAGFDILYSLQDLKIDRSQNLHSAPAKLGPKRSIYLSRLSFTGMTFFIWLAGFLHDAGHWYNLGVLAVAFLLSYEHWLVKDAVRFGHSINIKAAFFKVNMWVGLVYFMFVLINQYVSNLPHGK